jgi:hypothetical protein
LDFRVSVLVYVEQKLSEFCLENWAVEEREIFPVVTVRLKIPKSYKFSSLSNRCFERHSSVTKVINQRCTLIAIIDINTLNRRRRFISRKPDPFTESSIIPIRQRLHSIVRVQQNHRERWLQQMKVVEFGQTKSIDEIRQAPKTTSLNDGHRWEHQTIETTRKLENRRNTKWFWLTPLTPKDQHRFYQQ